MEILNIDIQKKEGNNGVWLLEVAEDMLPELQRILMKGVDKNIIVNFIE